MNDITVGLFGTCNNTNWRDVLIPMLNTNIKCFNPVVEDWNQEAYENELFHRENDDYIVYVLTPNWKGFYSLMEVADDSNKSPERTVFCVMKEELGLQFDVSQLKSLEACKKLISGNGAKVVEDLSELADYLNSKV